MDMISQIEMRDGVAAHVKLKDRLREIALFLAEQDGFLDSEPQNEWHVVRSHVSETSRQLAEPVTSVTLQLGTHTSSRLLRDLGHPEWDEFEEDGDRNLSRTFTFPTRYIYTDGWQDEIIEKAKASRLWWADRRYKDISRARGDAEERLNHLEEQLIEAAKALTKLQDEKE